MRAAIPACVIGLTISLLAACSSNTQAPAKNTAADGVALPTQELPLALPSENDPLPPEIQELLDQPANSAGENWPRALLEKMEFPSPSHASGIPDTFTVDSPLADDRSAQAFGVLQGMALFTIKQGKGERQLAVFSDPSSPYDRAFFDAVARAGDDLNATIHVLPLATGYHGNLAKEITVALSCASDPANAWKQWSMHAAQADAFNASENLEPVWRGFYLNQPAVAECQSADALMQVFGAAEQVGVDYTPVLVFENGQSWPSPTISREEIEKMWWYLDEKKSS